VCYCSALIISPVLVRMTYCSPSSATDEFDLVDCRSERAVLNPISEWSRKKSQLKQQLRKPHCGYRDIDLIIPAPLVQTVTGTQGISRVIALLDHCMSSSLRRWLYPLNTRHHCTRALMTWKGSTGRTWHLIHRSMVPISLVVCLTITRTSGT